MFHHAKSFWSSENLFLLYSKKFLCWELPNQAEMGVVTWSHLNVTVECNKKKVTLLNNVHGNIKSGRLLAIMGASGSGKTTLLNTIVSRMSKNMKVESGQVNLGGITSIGLVYQHDLFVETQTVKEQLHFVCNLRMRNLDRIQRDQKVVLLHL